MRLIQNKQPQALSFEEILSLPVLADAYTGTGRVKKVTLNKMKVIVFSPQNSGFQATLDIQSVNWGFFDGAGNYQIGSTNVNLTATTSLDDITSQVNADVLAAALNFGYTITIADIIWSGVFNRAFSNPSLAVNTSRQPSTVRDTMVNASVDITSTISLTTGQTGKVALQYADNTGFTTNVVTVQSASNGNTGSLTIGLNLSQTFTAALTGVVPAGKYYRLVTTNVTGTPTYGTPVIQEVLL